MRAEGYMVYADLDGQALTIDGTNKAGKVALFGAGRNDGPVTIPRAQIARVDFKKANALTNGALTIHTQSGQKYALHFRKKSADEFASLAEALNA